VRIRLAIDADNFVRDRRGMGRFARALARAALDDPAFEVTLLAQRLHAAALRETFGHDPAVEPSSRAARRGAFDVCWFPWNGMRYSVAAPAFVTLHDLFAFSEPAKGSVARMREQRPILRAARLARRIACDSVWTLSEARARLNVPPERLSVVPLAPDPYFSPGGAGPLPAALENVRFVLFVAGREPRKNARVLFEACARTLRAPRELLAVVGELSDIDALRLRAYGVPHLRLRASDELLRSLYRSAAIAAVPSRAEGFGLIAAEAMACAAPVIASNAAALPEVCGGAALLVDPDDVAAWSAALRRLLDDPAARAEYAAKSTARWAFAERGGFIRSTLAIARSVAGSG
jgi:glycosyltransferase involved in cell wall biosynthesis